MNSLVKILIAALSLIILSAGFFQIFPETQLRNAVSTTTHGPSLKVAYPVVVPYEKAFISLDAFQLDGYLANDIRIIDKTRGLRFIRNRHPVELESSYKNTFYIAELFDDFAPRPFGPLELTIIVRNIKDEATQISVKPWVY